MSHDIQRLAD
jgi:uncharacterized protein with HEPN domain